MEGRFCTLCVDFALGNIALTNTEQSQTLQTANTALAASLWTDWNCTDQHCTD